MVVVGILLLDLSGEGTGRAEGFAGGGGSGHHLVCCAEQ